MSVARRSARSRFTAALLSAALPMATLASVASVGVVGVAAAPPAAAAGVGTPPLTLDKSGPASILAGTGATYRLAVSNAGSPNTAPAYNVSFRDQLPLGVTYQPGSSTPSSVGDPAVSVVKPDPVDPATWYQVLVWSNTFDVQPGGTGAIGFTVTPDSGRLVVGSVFTDDAAVFANTDERTVPRFDADGDPVDGTYTATATDSATTQVSAIRITKSEPSPEHELVRGVHDNTVDYSLTVTNNSVAGTTGITVVDHLAAGLEFLGCGGVDNTPPEGSPTPEYVGAPSLTVVPAAASPCPTPVAVETVDLPAGGAGTGSPAGVYTRVTWEIGDLAAGTSATINYRAGIPLRRNTTTFPDPAPTPASGGQAANLSNNTGTSTRETDVEQSMPNYATSSGTYTGPVQGGSQEVSDSTSLSVTAEDLAMQKSVEPSGFAAGGTATYTLSLGTGEYRDASAVVVTDTLPNGLCPLSSTTNFTSAGDQPFDAECAAVPGSDPTIEIGPSGTPPSPWGYGGVAANADGTFTITFDTIAAIPADHVVTIRFKARMRSTYVGGNPTALGDAFVNTAGLVGSSDPLAGPNPPDPAAPVTVADASSARLTSSGMSIRKLIGKDRSVSDCVSAPDSDFADDTVPTYQAGDQICFDLLVTFSATNFTRNPVVTDFLPAGLAYGNAWTVAGNTVPDPQIAQNVNGSVITWTLGAPSGSPSATYIAPGLVFHVRVAARVTAGASGPAPDLTGNLMKYRSESTDGSAVSLRDQVDFKVAAPPPMTVTKTATPTSAVAGGQATYTVTPTNAGSLAASNALPVSTVQVWDVLPTAAPGISCAAVSAISGDGSCDVATNTVRWTVAGPLAAGASATPLTYVVTMPLAVAAGQTFTNTAGVRSYLTFTNAADTATHYPADNIDPVACGAVPPAPHPCDVPSVKDTANVPVPGVTLAKTGTTSITYPGGNVSGTTGNNTVDRATIGELVTYTVNLTVPAGTNLYNGVLNDILPTGVAYEGTAADVRVRRSTTGAGGPFVDYDVASAGGAVITSSSVVQVTWPASYTEARAAIQDHVFQVEFTTRVTTLAGNSNGTLRTNTASFASKDAPGGSAVPSPSNATYPVTIVEPSPSIAKVRTEANPVSPGQLLHFTVTAGNASGRAPLGDGLVVDCVPVGLVVAADPYGVTTPAGIATEAPVDGDGTNGCASGTKRLAWNVGQLAGGSSAVLPYTVNVAATAIGGDTYPNTATFTGGTLQDGTTTPDPTERTYSVSASVSTRVVGATVLKTVKPSTTTTPTIGERVTYVVTATIPADVNLYQASIVDSLPRGLDPDSVQLAGNSIGCSPACSVTAAPLGKAASGQNWKIGWTLGTVAASAAVRTLTAEYSVAVADLAGPFPVAGTTLTNAAVMSWDLSVKAPPASAGATFDRTSAAGSATVTVREPSVTVAKAVSPNATPAPGDVFTYTVTATNGSGTNVSTAYDVAVRDVVPEGVVVVGPGPAYTPIAEGGSTPDGGVLTGPTATGGGTITWPAIASLARSASQQFTYNARLAPSASLTVAGKTNTVTVTGYRSLADGAGRTYSGPSDSETVTPRFPNVTVAKTTPDGNLGYVGQPLTWRITITNSGNARAYGVDAVDTLPVNWTYTATTSVVVAGTPVSPPPTPVTGDNAGQQSLTWTDLGDLDPGETIVVTFTATPQEAVITVPGIGSSVAHTNAVAVAAEDATGASGNVAAPYHGGPASAVARIDAADLRMLKTHVGVPVAGQDFAWTLRVTNIDPTDTAVGPFTVTDTIAAPTTYVSAAGDGWTCGTPAGVVTCVRTDPADTLAPGASFPTITLTVAVPSDVEAGTVLSNTAAVSMRTYDKDPSNNAGTDTAPTTAQADLAISKGRSGPLVAGQNVTYTLDVLNNGPSTARRTITVTDTLPTGLTFVSASGDDWSCSQAAGTVTCTRATDLLSTQPAPQITVVAAVAPTVTGTVSNTAAVTGPTPDPVPSNDSSTSTGSVGTVADLAIVKTHGGSFVPGTAANSYTFTVSNLGPSDAAGVRVTDQLPAYLSYTGTKTDVSGAWTCDASPAGAPAPPARQTVTCALTGALAAGETAVVRLGIAVSVGAPPSGSFVNTASVTSDTDDPNPSNNTSTDTTGFTSSADLAIAKSPASQPVRAGENATWTLTVTNLGPSNSVGPTVVTDTLPPGTALVSAAGTGWDTCQVAGQVVTCSHPDGIPATGSLPAVTLVAAVAPSAGPATLVNSATVTGPTPDPNPVNNTATAEVVVTDEADLSIVKSFQAATATSGSTTSFTLTVTNAGPSDADDVVVGDALPAGLSGLSADGNGWTCAFAGTSLSCTRPTLAAGTASTVTVTVRVAAGQPAGTIANTATVVAGTTDPDPGNNTSTDAIATTVSADLAITKSHGGAVVAGQQVTFSLVVSNLGPSDAAAPITVRDTLPAGLTFLSAGAGWGCVVTGAAAVDQVVTCTRDGSAALPAGTSAPTLTLTALVAVRSNPVTLSNTATVTSGTPDPDPSNNTGTDSFTVSTLADLAIAKTHAGSAYVTMTKAFTLTVTNNGPATATGVVVTDTLPAALGYLSATGTGWTCSAAGRAVTCTFSSDLAAGAVAPPITLRVRVLSASRARVVNTAAVSATTQDPNPGNNTATDTLVVQRLPQRPARPIVVKPIPGGLYILAGRTNGNQAIGVVVLCYPASLAGDGLLPKGDRRYCTVSTVKGAVVVRTNGPFPMRVRVTFFARGTATHQPYRVTATYTIRRR